MSAADTGGPAFPLPTVRFEDGLGMTLRDYFAAKAMQAIITSNHRTAKPPFETAYEIADAMLKARQS